jgi:polar amino acid transport system substrate-binding protein
MDENGSGIQLDIIRQALLSQNVSTQFTHVPLARSILNYRRSNVDAVSLVPSNFKHQQMFISEPYITYQNVAVSLTEREIDLKDVEDLVGLNVAAFQKAGQFLGDKFSNRVTTSSGYREIADQRKQIDMLYTGQTEVIILDVNIFNHFINSHDEDIYDNAFKIHYIFEKKAYSAGFKSEVLKNKFEKGISLIRNNGEYQEIIKRYL